MQEWQQALAGEDVAFCQTTLIVCALFVAWWFWQSYVFWRLGHRFVDRPLSDYLLPIYGSIYLCRAIGVSVWWTVSLWFWPTTLFSLIYMGGAAAERLSKPFWKYGFFSALGGVGLVLLAFDGRESAVADEIHPLYSDAPGNHTPVLIFRSNGCENMTPIPQQGIVIGNDPKQSQLVCTAAGVANTHVKIMIDREYPNTVVVEDLSTSQGTYYWDRRYHEWHRLVWPMRFHLYQMVRIRIGATNYIVEINPG